MDAMNNVLATTQALSSSEIQPKKAKGLNEAGFEGALTLAGAAMQALVPMQNPVQSQMPEGKVAQILDGAQGVATQPTPVPVQDNAVKGNIEALQPHLNQQSATSMLTQAAAAPVKGQLVANRSLVNAGKAPISQMPAASLNTVAASAGPKPWSSAWVFQGDAEVNSMLSQPEKAVTPKTSHPAEAKPLMPETVPVAEPSLAAVMAELMAPKAAPMKVDGKPGKAEMPQAPVNVQATPAQAQSLMDLLAMMPAVNAVAAQRVKGGEAKAANFNSADAENAVVAGNALMLEPGSDFEIEPNMERNETQGPVFGRKAVSPAPVSLSGAEFLNALREVRQEGPTQAVADPHRGLKVIEGGSELPKSANPAAAKLKRVSGTQELFGGQQMQQQAVGQAGHVAQRPVDPTAMNVAKTGVTAEMMGQVIKGSMARDRLATDSVVGLNNQIRNFMSNGGGEIRLRLKPENLGELHLRVVTQGNNVGLQIHASDENAKSIIEGSLNHLKESLAAQSLNLSSVDFSVAQPAGSSSGSQFQASDQPQHGNPQHQAFDGLMGQNSGRGQQDRGDGMGGDSDLRQGRIPVSPAKVGGAFSSAQQGGLRNGRLDMTV